MIQRIAACALALTAVVPSPARAADETPTLTPEQQAQMDAFVKAGTPGSEHAALAKMAGSYALEIRSWHAPDADPTMESGTATRRMTLGDRVLVEEVTATMMGQPWSGFGMHGYDNAAGRYWSTWNDSMSTGVMVSDGSCDAKMACAFSGSWTDPVTKEKVGSRMTTRWSDDATQVFEMYGPGPDGREVKMMEITYRRK